MNHLNRWHNLLRGTAVTGEDAMDDILYSLFLCYLAPKVSTTGNFDIANSEKDCYDDEEPEDVADWISKLDIGYLSDNTAELVTKPISNSSIYKIGELLSRHPLTKQLITNKQFIHCKKPVVVQQLLQECNAFAQDHNIFSKIDIVGYAWEYFNTKHGGNGGSSKELGQYFTERPVMGMCCQLFEPDHIRELGIDSSSTLGDEFCATFGFPLYTQKYLKDTFGIHIQDHNMYGVEFEDRLSRMGIMNAMFSLSQTDNVKCGDSFITNVSPHLDVSVHNVPFGKSMKCTIVKDNYKMETGLPPFDEVVPIQKNGDAMLATQVVVYKTRKMGVVIIKDGEETSGTSNKKWRQWMCDACVIHKIMKIPTGAFSHTGTKTVCIYFTKHEGQTTKSIQFLELSDSGEQITEICTVSRQDLEDNNYSWDPNAYIVDETMEKLMASSNCEWKKLGDVCEIQNGKQLSKKHFKEGPYPVIGGGQTPTGYHSEYNKEAHTILCSQSGSAGFISRYSTPIWASDCFGICAFEEITNDFLYYYLKNIQHEIYKLQSGAAQPHVYSRDIQNLDIPIPTQLVQTEVVSKLDDLAQQRQNLTDLCGGVERRMKYYFEMMIKKHRGEIVMEKLGDVCEWIKSGIAIKKEKRTGGEYPYYGANGQIKDSYMNTYLYDGEFILCAQDGSIGEVHLTNGKFWVNNHAHIIQENDTIRKHYLYYLLKYSVNYTILTTGMIPKLTQDKLRNLDIPIPTQLVQTEIVNYLDALEAERQSCTKQTEDIDKMMREILVQSYQDTSIVSQDAPTIANVATAMSQSVAHDHDAIMDDVQTAITDSLQNAIVSLPCATEPFAKVRRLDDDETPLPTATIDDVRCATAAC